MRPYEIMVILDPTLDERTVAPSLETFLNVVRKDGGKVEKVDIWGKRRLAYEIAKHAEGIYVVIDVKAAPATVSELDRQLQPQRVGVAHQGNAHRQALIGLPGTGCSLSVRLRRLGEEEHDQPPNPGGRRRKLWLVTPPSPSSEI
ncbi:30S ribosomal protein S6 [Mycobacterium tuberculosis RGTB423]|nr:30S ribosomal protein S6 [Mycobacterium tuberculosis RGTB423]